jgi:hypothetical protein
MQVTDGAGGRIIQNGCRVVEGEHLEREQGRTVQTTRYLKAATERISMCLVIGQRRRLRRSSHQ